MASMKLGSKAEVFHLEGQTWLCSTGLPSDVTFEVGETYFHLHKFPLLSRSRTLETLIGDSSEDEKRVDDENSCVLELHDLPGGAKAFLLVAKFCYGVKLELNATNVVGLRCAAEYLQMTEEYGEGNLITHTENFLNEVFASWVDTFKALESCEEVLVLPRAEELHIVSRCINSLAIKACVDPGLFSWPVAAKQSPTTTSTALWNGIRTVSMPPHPMTDDWWYEDVSLLKLPFYKRLITSLDSRGMAPERIAGSVVYYAKKYLPLLGSRESSFQNGIFCSPSDSDQKCLLEEIVKLLPDQKSVIPTKFLLRLLRTSMILHASSSCRENLEKRIGLQLDQAVIEDILIPNTGYSVETLYDIDCVQRILDHFMLEERDEVSETASGSLADDGQLIGYSHSLTPLTMVANLIDSYLAEVAPDVNLKLEKFQALAAIVPEYARQLDDGIYRAIDIFLKAHPWLTDSERESLCRLMDCQKLSLEASTHAAQNERLPLRVIVQVLFFEQLRLRTSVAGWFFVSGNLEQSQNQSTNLGLRAIQAVPGEAQHAVGVEDMKDRVSELEKECLTMKKEIDKLVKTRGMSWSSLCKMFGLRLKSSKSGEPKASKVSPQATKVSPQARKALFQGNENEEDR